MIRFDKPEPEPSSHLLYQVLRRCTGLRKLLLPSSEVTLDIMPRIIGGVVGLTGITKLGIGRIGQLSKALLNSMDSPLMAIDFSALDHSFGRESPNPIELLAGYSNSLEELALRFVDWDAIRFDLSHAFPSLRVLHISGAVLPRIDILIRAFPNLKILLFDEIYLDDRQERLDSIRQENRQSQLRHQWQDLGTIYTNFNELYVLAPRCRINRLQLSLVSGRSPVPLDTRMNRLKSALVDCTPSKLTINIDSNVFINNLADGLFAIPGMERLHMKVNPSDSESLADLVNGIKASLNSSPLQLLYLTLSGGCNSNDDMPKYFLH